MRGVMAPMAWRSTIGDLNAEPPPEARSLAYWLPKFPDAPPARARLFAEECSDWARGYRVRVARAEAEAAAKAHELAKREADAAAQAVVRAAASPSTPEARTCPKCDEPADAGAKFCADCGAPLDDDEEPDEPEAQPKAEHPYDRMRRLSLAPKPKPTPLYMFVPRVGTQETTMTKPTEAELAQINETIRALGVTDSKRVEGLRNEMIAARAKLPAVDRR